MFTSVGRRGTCYSCAFDAATPTHVATPCRLAYKNLPVVVRYWIQVTVCDVELTAGEWSAALCRAIETSKVEYSWDCTVIKEEEAPAKS